MCSDRSRRPAPVILARRTPAGSRDWNSGRVTASPVDQHVLDFARAVTPGIDPADVAGLDAAFTSDGLPSPWAAVASVLPDGPIDAAAVDALLAAPATATAAAAGIRAAQQAYYGNPRGLAGGDVRSWSEVGYLEEQPGTTWPDLHDLAPRMTAFADIGRSYDVIVIGTGAGSIVARTAAEAGARVLIVERGQWLAADAQPDHLRNQRVISGLSTQAGPIRAGNPRVAGDTVVTPVDGGWLNNAMTVGGGMRVFGAQAWRFCAQDFAMASTYGVPDGSSLADWPFGYAELAPYYDRAEYELGVSGDPVGNAFAGARTRDYPMPPLPLTASGRLLLAGARELGWGTAPVPLLINSRPYHGRAACQECGTCVGFSCRANAKNGTHNTALPLALATGRCDLAVGTAATRIVTDAGGKVTGVRLQALAADGTPGPTTTVDAGEVVVSAGATETARLLLLSAHDGEPHGLGNNTDQVGRHLQGHVYAGALGLVDEQVQFGQGPGASICTNDFRHDNDGIIGGGMLANDFVPIPLATLGMLSRTGMIPAWGAASAAAMAHSYTRHLHIMGPIQEVSTARARVRLDTSVRDSLGLPVARFSGSIHPEDVRTAHHHADRAVEWLEASGATRIAAMRPGPRATADGPSGGQHQAGTCRMGSDPATSVVDPEGRVWGHDNLRVADGSVHVTNGGVNPVLTILANAYRIAELMTKRF